MERNQNKEDIKAQIHAGRRNKLRERFLRDGLDTFNECEVIEFALGFCVPRIDTNPTAHALINKYGSLIGVLNADPSDYESVFGIGKNTSVFLAFLKQFTTYMAKQNVCSTKIITPSQAVNYLTPLMKSYTVEKFLVVCLDSAGKVKIAKTMTNNALDKVNINLRDLITMVSLNKAASVIVAHNHLNGDPSPSIADMNLTRRLVSTFDTFDIEFTDHLIIAGDNFYSFANSGLLEIFKREPKHR